MNVCNDKNKCDFYFPSIITDENLVVGISTSGRDHKKSKAVTEQIQELFVESAQDH